MRTLGLLLALLLFAAPAAPAAAEKAPVPISDGGSRTSCNLGSIAINWDFNAGGQGFFAVECDEAATPVWQYGLPFVIDPPGYVWGTILNGDYPDDAGEGLRSPHFVVTEATRLLEIEHWVEAETGYDGCNVCAYVDEQLDVLLPVGGYPAAEISPSGSYYANCVDGEPGWTGNTDPHWRVDCFDLSALLGQDVQIQLDFGSDATNHYRGWYIAAIRVGAVATATGACCDPIDGGCQVATETVCVTLLNGIWHPEATNCEVNPCPPEPLLRVGGFMSAEPWHAYVGPSIEPLHLEFHLPPDNLLPVYQVRFFYSVNGGANWLVAGMDDTGGEPILDTFGTSEPVGDGWATDFVVPTFVIPPDTIQFAANAYKELVPKLVQALEGR